MKRVVDRKKIFNNMIMMIINKSMTNNKLKVKRQVANLWRKKIISINRIMIQRLGILHRN